jgi:hypothetical protein
MISNVDLKYTAEYIANIFWRRDIGKVSSITLIPQIENGDVSNTAYITFGSFCDSESGRDFIRDMTSVVGYMFAHADPVEDDFFWVIEPNTHHLDELCVGEFTTKFTDDFFVSHSSSDSVAAQVVYDENNKHQYPIRDLDGVYCSIETALDHLAALNQECDETKDPDTRSRLTKEIEHYEMEIAKHTDISKLENLYSQFMTNITNDEIEEDWRNYMEQISSIPPPQREVAGIWLPPLTDDLSECTIPSSMERQVAMTDQEIEDLLREQQLFKEQFEVK